MLKLNQLLAKTDHLGSVFSRLLTDYVQFFKNNQGSFKGEKKTYVPREGTIDNEKMRTNKLVVATVDEKLKYMVDTVTEYIDTLFSQEATNANGGAKAELKVGDTSFGILSSLELLRLKSLLENASLKGMYENIPVRNDDEIWQESVNEMYRGMGIFESEKTGGVAKTTTKEQYILSDPNVSKDASNYVPQVASKDTVMELGDYTYQKFSGEYSHRQRAEILKRRSELLTAVIVALKEANECPVIESEMTAEKLFNFLHQ